MRRIPGAVTTYIQPRPEAFASAWGVVDQTGTQAILASEGLGSITDGGVGITTFTWAVPFSDATYGVAGTSTTGGFVHSSTAITTASTIVRRLTDAGAAQDGAYTVVVASGRHAARRNKTSQVAHAWISVDSSSGTPTRLDGIGVASMTDNGAGDFTFNWTVPFKTADYPVVGQFLHTTISGHVGYDSTTARTAAQIRLDFQNVDAAAADGVYNSVLAWGVV